MVSQKITTCMCECNPTFTTCIWMWASFIRTSRLNLYRIQLDVLFPRFSTVAKISSCYTFYWTYNTRIKQRKGGYSNKACRKKLYLMGCDPIWNNFSFRSWSTKGSSLNTLIFEQYALFMMSNSRRVMNNGNEHIFSYHFGMEKMHISLNDELIPHYYVFSPWWPLNYLTDASRI